jgi:hypothetical protein
MPLRLATGYLVMPFRPGSSHEGVQNVVLAGRIPASTVVDGTRSSEICASDCARPGDITDQSCAYNLLIEALDTLADVLAHPDFSGRVDMTRECDAISAGVLFPDGVTTGFGGLAPAAASEQLPNRCP